MSVNDITGVIVDVALQIHKDLGPGLLESVYEAVLAKKLEQQKLKVERQKVLQFEYEGIVFDEGFRMDLLVEGQVIVELKSVEQLVSVHKKQLLTYVKLARKPAGLLLNFGAALLKDGICRIINAPEASLR
jgi:iron complex transport system substrate-binding protein